MKTPLQIHFHDMPVSPALETLIREKAAKLEQFKQEMAAGVEERDRKLQSERKKN